MPENNYPNGRLLVSAQWLKKHTDDTDIVIVDVRDAEYFDGRLIPGTIRLPWSDLRYNNMAIKEGSLFVGSADAQIMNRSTFLLGGPIATDRLPPRAESSICAFSFSLQPGRSEDCRLLDQTYRPGFFHLQYGGGESMLKVRSIMR